MKIQSKKLRQYGVLFLLSTCLLVPLGIESLGATDIAIAPPASSSAVDPFLGKLERLALALRKKAVGTAAARGERIREANSDIEKETEKLCASIIGKTIPGSSNSMSDQEVTETQRQVIVDLCLHIGVLYKGDYKVLAKLFLKDLEQSTPEQATHQYNCAAIALIASLYAAGEENDPTALATDIGKPEQVFGVAEPRPFFTREQIISLLRAVEALQGRAIIWRTLPALIQHERREYAVLQGKVIEQWQASIGLGMDTTPSEMRTRLEELQRGTSLTAADVQTVEQLKAFCRALLHVTAGSHFLAAQRKLNEIGAYLSAMPGDDASVKEFLQLPVRVRGAKNIAALLKLDERTQRMSPPAPLPRSATWEERNDYQRALSAYSDGGASRFPLKIAKIREKIREFAMQAAGLDAPGETAADFLALCRRDINVLKALYPQLVKRAIEDESPGRWERLMVAGAPLLIPGGTRDVSGDPDSVAGAIGAIPYPADQRDRFRDSALITRAQEAYIAEETARLKTEEARRLGVDESTLVHFNPCSTVLTLFDESFPRGRPLQSDAPLYIDPQYLRDYSRVEDDGRGGGLTLANARLTPANARGYLQRVVDECAGAGRESYLIPLRYNILNALNYFREHPDRPAIRNNCLLYLVSAGAHCPVAKHEASTSLNRVIFNGRDPRMVAAGGEQSFVGQIAQTLFDERSAIFLKVINFRDDRETGATTNNYRLRLANLFRVADGDSALPYRSWGKGYMGRAFVLRDTYSRSSPDAPDDVFNLTALQFLRRFYYGKSAYTPDAYDNDETRLEKARTHGGYTAEEILFKILTRINEQNNVETGVQNLVQQATNYLSQKLEAQDFNRFIELASEDAEKTWTGRLECVMTTLDETGLQKIAAVMKDLPHADREPLKEVFDIRCQHWGDERDEDQRDLDQQMASEENPDATVRAAAIAANAQGEQDQEEYLRAVRSSAFRGNLSPAQKTALLTKLKVVLVPAGANPATRSAACLEAIRTLLREALTNPLLLNTSQRKEIAKMLYTYAVSVLGQAYSKITAEGALRILVLTGHILEGQDPKERFRAIAQQVINDEEANAILRYVDAHEEARVSPIDDALLKNFAYSRMQQIVSFAKELRAQNPSISNFRFSRDLREAAFAPLTPKLGGEPIQPFELARARRILRMAAADAY